MRSRKELIYCNVKDLTPKEIEALADYDLNCCDMCGEIDLSTDLYWIDGEDFIDREELEEARKKGCVALCDDCYTKELVKGLGLED